MKFGASAQLIPRLDSALKTFAHTIMYRRRSHYDDQGLHGYIRSYIPRLRLNKVDCTVLELMYMYSLFAMLSFCRNSFVIMKMVITFTGLFGRCPDPEVCYVSFPS